MPTITITVNSSKLINEIEKLQDEVERRERELVEYAEKHLNEIIDGVPNLIQVTEKMSCHESSLLVWGLHLLQSSTNKEEK